MTRPRTPRANQATTGPRAVTGTGESRNDSYGVRLSALSSGQIKSLGSGGIAINATGNGTSANSIAGADSIIGGGDGPITLNANSRDRQVTHMSVQTTGSVTIQPRTAGRKINRKTILAK